MDSMLDGVSALVLAAYLGGVLFNGNITPMINDLMKEYGYLELLVAFYIVKEAMNFGPTSEVVKLLVIVGVGASIIKLAGIIDQTKFSDFYNGKIGLFELINSIFSQIGQTFNPVGSK